MMDIDKMQPILQEGHIQGGEFSGASVWKPNEFSSTYRQPNKHSYGKCNSYCYVNRLFTLVKGITTYVKIQRMSSSEGDQFVSESNFEELVALAKCLDCVWTENFHPCDCKFRKTPEGKARCEQLRAEQEKRNATDICPRIKWASTSGSGQPSKPSEPKDSTGNAPNEPTSSRKQSSEPETSNNQNGSAERENTPRGSGEKENPNQQTEFAQPMTSTVDSQGQPLEPGANRDSLKGDAGDPETGRSSNDLTISDSANSENPDTPNSPRNSGNQGAPNSDIKTTITKLRVRMKIQHQIQLGILKTKMAQGLPRTPNLVQTLREILKTKMAQGLPRTPNLVQTLPETLKTKMTPNLEIQIHPGILILRRKVLKPSQIRRETPKMQMHQQIQR
ncbi:RNA polymerase-associated protein CTR9 [Orchesella cincta]|uniref:RNA polymerase-associated protein CTR9 n=1 Tax=Orchesella cincta TaxID=48709 RepID=A0A1D2M2B9_ORCCI|nr:RNA polymerase-associated protein CTR9 [Orchesella cincta]